MKLKTVIIINEAPFEELRLNFSDDNVAVLSGINGAGKTTIISYIVDAFYELAKKIFFNEFENKFNKFYRISSMSYSIDYTKISIVYLRFIENDVNVDYVYIKGNCNQEIYDGKLMIDNPIPFSLIQRELKENGFSKKISINNKNEISSIFYNNLLTYFPSYRYEIPSFLNDPYKIKLNFKNATDFTGYLINPIEVASDLPNIANWIMDVVLDSYLYKGNTSNIFNQLNMILTYILFSKIGCKARLGIGPRTMGASRISIINKDTGEQIYPSIFSMSSGELSLLCLFGELAKQSDKIGKLLNDVSGIVLVDEIDKHLHIRLQKEVLPKLISMFPKIQFIVSSHSPFFGLGLEDKSIVTYEIYDLNNGGISCLPQENELFNEVYKMMVHQNERYFSRYKDLQEKIKNDHRALIITEGKTDWKHIKAAKEALNIVDIDFEIYEYNDTLGDSMLLTLLKNYARIGLSRKIIGIFDRDNFSSLKYNDLKANRYVNFGNNVYGFSIPLVNMDLYGEEISIEHYYKKEDLLKEYNGKRLFLGEEFYEKGLSKNGKYLTRIKGIKDKVGRNAIIDDKVYDKIIDLEEKNSLALSKNSFADLILNKNSFADGFDFSMFNEIFNIIRKILNNNA